jgi:hypothetical protein
MPANIRTAASNPVANFIVRPILPIPNLHVPVMQDMISVLPDHVFVQHAVTARARFQIECCARDAVASAVVSI